ncbi:MAG: hypothetical protein DVB27_03755 [Verrucomicrobia bacterium]|jgi:hypothetical protein|nr:MAG: hypothetical protein DVB27_03755 [Verrucomicrobiota bacterium]
MKLGKEEIQKLVLGGLLVIGVIYCYFTLLLGPLSRRQAATRKGIEDLGPMIAAAKAQIARTADVERAAPANMEATRQVTSMIPDGSPVAWFPPRVGDFFKQHGLEKSTTRLAGEIVEKEMVGFRRMSWSIDLPKVAFVPFATAVASLENEEPLLEISGLQIESGRDDLGSQRALLTVSNYVKQ